MEIKSSNADLSSACIILCFYSSMFAFKLSRFIKRVNIDLGRNPFAAYLVYTVEENIYTGLETPTNTKLNFVMANISCP